jgi:uncharacterized protein (TIGR03437 family)
LTFEGTGSLSRNGRYLLVRPDSSPAATSSQPTWVDLQTGQQQSLPLTYSPAVDVSMSGRVLAEDGTAVLSGCSGLCVYRGGQLIAASAEPSMEPVIDSAGQIVVYTSLTRSPSSQRYLRVYRIGSRQDGVFEQPNGDTYSPSLSADGKRVMFLSTAQLGTTDPPGTTQLYTINLDGGGVQELTSATEPSGVQEYTMSDDGQVAWYVAGDGKLVKLDLSTGQTMRTVYRPAAVDLSTTLVPGSAITWNAAGISDAKIIIGGIPVPLLSVAPNSITVQVPWEIPAEQPATIQVVINSGTAEASVQGTVGVVASRPALLPVPGCTMPGLCDLGGASIHQDWSAYVSPDRPALPGEVLHFFETGFGPVRPTPATGTPAPANPLAVLPNPPVCTSDPGGPANIVYLGLAPGLIGYYQMDVQMPPAFSTVHPTENRTYDQFYINCGPGVVTIFAIQTRTP